MNKLVKLAAGDQEFEQAFFQLAYDKIQTKLYNLLPFLVGFQLVKKSEDSTKAVGVFGFKSNNGQILFVPSFFINGKIKDMDIMYSRNNNQFYPLTEEFAELFLKDDVTGVGTPSTEKREKITRSIGQPNMRDVIWPPRTGRITYAEAKDLEEKNEVVFEKVSCDLLSTREYTPAPSLCDFVKESDTKTKSAFWELLNKRADFCESVRRFYTDEEIANCLRVEKQAAAVIDAKVEIIEFEDTAKAKLLPEEGKKRVAKDGYVIVDKRPDQDKSDVGMFKFTETFGNPTRSGFYPYITELGTIRYGLILMQPQKLLAGFNSNKAIIIDLEAARKGQVYITPSSKVYVKDQIEIKNLSDALKGLEELAEGDPSYNDYILINENLACTEPFQITENYKDGSGIRRVKVNPSWRFEDDGCCLPCKGGKKDEPKDAMLILTKRPGDKLEFRQNAVYVPKGFKLLRVHLDTSYYASVDWNLPEDERKKRSKEVDEEKQRVRMGKPGGLYCLTGLLRERNTFPLTVHTNGSQYFLNVGGAKVKFENPIEAKIAMVAEVGLAEKDAEELLRDLIPNKKREGYIKLAVTGDHIFSLQDEQPMTNELGQPTYFGVPWVDQYDGSDGYTDDPTQMGLGVMPENEASNTPRPMQQQQGQQQQGQQHGQGQGGIDSTVNSAVDMAQNGQKEVFDTQAIAALSRYTDTSTKIVEYIPNFVTSLDKLGRMLFLAYWDTEKFEKMYGKDELPELIELIKNVFTNLGDLIIFLKRKIPDISINSNEQSMDGI